MACWAAAFQDVEPKRMYAAGINLANLCIGGVRPKTGKHYVNYLWNEGGQGARSYKDGNPFQMMIFIGGATNQPVEIAWRAGIRCSTPTAKGLPIPVATAPTVAGWGSTAASRRSAP